MKNGAYKLYSAMFNLYSILPLKRGRVALLSPHKAKFTDSLGEMEKELMSRGGYEIVRISGTDIKPVKPSCFTDNLKNLWRIFLFFTRKARYLATSEYVFLNDNFMPMSDLRFKKQTVITQLWHAEGAFKKFGLDLNLSKSVYERVKKGNERLDYVVCSSEKVAPIYAGAFGVLLKKILPLGSPRADRYISGADSTAAKEFLKKHSIDPCKGIVLYAPTFRDNEDDNRRLLESFDFDKFNSRFKDKYTLVLRLHPQINSGVKIPEGVVNMTDLENADELFYAADILVTDYSSICMNFALLGKPIVFYAFDLKKYGSDRSFYFDYKEYVPGPVAETFDDLLDAVETARANGDKLKKFIEINFDKNDGGSAKRIADAVTSRKRNL
ncbi:MAG: hypothetical protein GX107_03445 [Clostridiales bacterium]|nr:hypothetical protein [Clostridiales bacterium]